MGEVDALKIFHGASITVVGLHGDVRGRAPKILHRVSVTVVYLILG